MVLDSSQYKYIQHWYKTYENAKAAGILTAANDMPLDYVLQDEFLDPLSSSSLRYYPVNYQDFLVCQDVNSMFYWMYSRRSANYQKYSNPYLPVQPQPATYYHGLNSDTPYAGHFVWTSNYDINQGNHPYCYVLSCASDTPGILADVPENSFYVTSRPYSQTFDYEPWQSISSTNGSSNLVPENMMLWAACSCVNIETGYALSGPSFTVSLSSKLANLDLKAATYCDYPAYYAPTDLCCKSTVENLWYSYGGTMWAQSGGGQFQQHQMYRSSSTDAWLDRWRGSATNSTTYAELINWYIDSSLSVQYCAEKTSYPPKDNPSSQSFRLYTACPTLCYYGNLSVDLYQTWTIVDTDARIRIWKKRKIEFEPSSIEVAYGNLCQPMKVLRSKQTFTFQDLYCLWDPYDEDDAKTTINNIRQQAGLSPWQFTDQPIPRSQWQSYVHSCQLLLDDQYLVWRFEHPLTKPAGYEYPNQTT